MVKNIFRYFFSIYALLVFIPTALMAYLIYVLVINLSPRARIIHNVHKVSVAWAHVFYALIFVRVKILNVDGYDKTKVYVCISNHRSLLDVPAWALACRHAVRFLSKEEMTKIPVFGYVLKRVYLTVNRADRNDRLRSLEKMKATLAQGISVFLAPEGTRNRSKNILLDFKDGAFRLAIAAQVPLRILTLYNSDNLLSPASLFSLKPGTIYGVWENPVATAGMTDNDISNLKQQARAISEKNYLIMKNMNHKI